MVTLSSKLGTVNEKRDLTYDEKSINKAFFFILKSSYLKVLYFVCPLTDKPILLKFIK